MNKTHRKTRTGKIARLPKIIRDIVNNSIRDGIPYTTIIDALGAHGKLLNEDNLTNWKKGGYQDWLKEQALLDKVSARQEFARDLVRHNEQGKIHEATLQIAVAQICEILLELDPASLKDSLKADPNNYTRLLNVLARLSQGGLRCEREREEEAKEEIATRQALARLKNDPSMEHPFVNLVLSRPQDPAPASSAPTRGPEK